jgi:hypothetical protein
VEGAASVQRLRPRLAGNAERDDGPGQQPRLAATPSASRQPGGGGAHSSPRHGAPLLPETLRPRLAGNAERDDGPGQQPRLAATPSA